jgi:hypothetical protein
MVSEAVLTPPSVERNSEALAKERAFGITESWTAGLVLALILALRVIYARVYRVDSDETQHLHVVWGWVHGLLPYRDLFDNHSPLFQMACAPLFGALGEHPWILIPMRLAMLPLYLADLWIVYLIGKALYCARWGLWIALAAGCLRTFFLVTAEFRTDDLWTTLWLLAVWLAVAAPLSGRRAFFFGLAIGACFSTSMKTSLLVVALGSAAAGVAALHGLSRTRMDWRRGLQSAALVIGGAVIIPGIIVAFFAAHGAFHQMVYCVIQHNAAPGLGKWAKSGFHQWLFPLWIPVMMALGWLCLHSSAKSRIGAGRALIVMTWGSYYFLLRSYWPLVTAQDFTPVLPLEALSVLPLLFHLLSLTRWPGRITIPATTLVLLATEIASIWRAQPATRDEVAPLEKNLAIILRLTDPHDLVMDGKGETIFRNRPIYWVLEGITIRRIQLGFIPNDVRAQMIKTGTCVAIDNRIRPEDQDWLRDNFLECEGKVWIAGKDLGKARSVIGFHTDIAARYSLVAANGGLAGTLDGAPLRDSQQIAAGDHALKIAQGRGEVFLVWSQALERGLNPSTKMISGL